VSGPEISTKKSHSPVHIAFKKHLASAGREAAMNSDRRSSDKRGRLSYPLVPRFEASN